MRTPLRQAILVIYLTTAIMLLMFPVALANWMEDKDFAASPVGRWVVTPVTDLVASLGPAAWNAAARGRVKGLVKRSD